MTPPDVPQGMFRTSSVWIVI